MAGLTPTEIAVCAILGSGSTRNRDKLVTAVAVALGESGGNPNAHNDKPPDDSYGLWQINMLGNLGPSRRERFGLKSNAELFNPIKNATAMWSISSGGSNFRPWTQYTNGGYRNHLTDARTGVNEALGLGAKALFDAGNAAVAKAQAGGAPVIGGGGTIGGQFNLPGGASVGGELPGAGGILSGLDAIGAFFSTLSQGDTWIRVLWVVAGLLLIVISAVLLGLDLWKGGGSDG